MSTTSAPASYARDLARKFYVYVHRRATDGRIFYVGKGCGSRAHEQSRNKHWHNIVAKHGYTVHFVDQNLDEATAFELERFMIAFCGRDTLCNMTDGGEGVSGWMPSPATREKWRLNIADPVFKAKHRAAIVAVVSSPEKRAKMSASALARKVPARRGFHLNEETKAKLSAATKLSMEDPARRDINREANRGRTDWIGRKHKLESIEKMRVSTRITMADPTVRAHLREFNLGKKLSPETCAKIAASNKGRLVSDETRAKIRAALVGKPHVTSFKHSQASRDKLRENALAQWTKRKAAVV